MAVSFTTSFAQTDTTITYLNKDWEVTTEDSAFYIQKMYNEKGLYAWKQYQKEGMSLVFEALYADPERKKIVGDYKEYKDGSLYRVESYNETGELLSARFFYPNGTKMSELIMENRKLKSEVGWDENGNVIKDYIVMREAKFKGGPAGWRDHLLYNLRMDAPIKAGVASGNYTVVVEFTVDEKGRVSDLIGKSKQNCRPCVEEAIRVIERGPKWIPAILNNKPVVYRQRQSITFQLPE